MVSSSPWIESGVDLGFWFVERKEDGYIKKEEKRKAKRNHYQDDDGSK